MSQDIIKPSNGRIVLFTPGPDFAGIWHDQSQQLAASICHVWGDRMVNLDVIDSNGIHWPVTSVGLLQPGDAKAYEDRYCEWMPYQKGQAGKTEQLQAKLDVTTPKARPMSEWAKVMCYCPPTGSPDNESDTAHVCDCGKLQLPATDGGPNPDYIGSVNGVPIYQLDRSVELAKHVAEINPPERNCSNCGSAQWCSPTCHRDGPPKDKPPEDTAGCRYCGETGPCTCRLPTCKAHRAGATFICGIPECGCLRELELRDEKVEVFKAAQAAAGMPWPAGPECLGGHTLVDCPFPNCDCPGGNGKKP